MSFSLALFALSLGASSPAPRAVDAAADALAIELLSRNPEAPVAVFVEAPTPELGRAFQTLLLAKLAEHPLAPLPLEAAGPVAAEMRARELAARSLVRVRLSLENGLLQLRGDLLPTSVNFWSGRTASRSEGVAAALQLSVEADAHTLALSASPLKPVTGAIVPVNTELRFLYAPFAKLPALAAAIGSGDLDGDGKDELVALTDDDLVVFSGEGAVLARKDLRQEPLARSLCREAFGAVDVIASAGKGFPPGKLYWLNGKRQRAEQLAFEKPLRQLGEADGRASLVALKTAGPLQFRGRLEAGQNVLVDVEFTEEGARFAEGLRGQVLSLFVGRGELAGLAQDGSSAQLLFRAKNPGSSEPPRYLRRRIGGVGAATLGDVDGDGRAELIASSPLFAPAAEELRVMSFDRDAAEDAAPVVRWQSTVTRGRVTALARAELDGDGIDELFIALALPDGTTELQLLRRLKP